MKCDVHVNYLWGRLSQLCGITYRLSSIPNLESASKCTSHASTLCKIYKKCVVNLFIKFVAPNCCVFKAVRILKLPDIQKYNIGVYMFKIIKLQYYPTLQSTLRLEYPQYHYNTRHREEVSTPFPRINNSIVNDWYQCSKI